MQELDSLYFGANEPKTGAIESIDQFLDRVDLNHKVVFSGGHMQKNQPIFLESFFNPKDKRKFLKNYFNSSQIGQ
jgi:tRNA(Arg) A34 adenosine deaminase TadA